MVQFNQSQAEKYRQIINKVATSLSDDDAAYVPRLFKYWEPTASVGIYLSAIAATSSSNTSDSPTMTIKTPKIQAGCHNTFLTTTNCAKIDKVNSKFTLRGELWRVDKDSVMQSMYRNIIELYNS